MSCGDKKMYGKVALVTGAAQGIGQAIAIALANAGAQVIASDINDGLGQALVKETHGNITYLHLDVKEEDSWRHGMSEILRRFGKLNILVNNAGITGFQEGFGPQDPEHASLESWRKISAVNSDGVFLGCKYAIQTMKLSGEEGSIVNISSRSGLVGIPGAAAYAASKAAVRNHTKTVALYCCQQGYSIRCNSIHPAAIVTPMWDPMLGSGSDREAAMCAISKDIPMGRMGVPEDVANAVLFLASEDARYITGIELTIDGGILAGASASPKRKL